MSIILRSSYSLFPSCSDPLSQNVSANKNVRRQSSRRISASRQATLCDRERANKDEINEALTIVNKKQSPANMSSRLIPLKLQKSEENRSQRTSYPPTTIPSISTNPPATPRKQRPGPVTDLIIVPYTEDEWKIVMEEVKILYLKGQYKHCSMRCRQVLDGITVGVFKKRV